MMQAQRAWKVELSEVSRMGLRPAVPQTVVAQLGTVVLDRRVAALMKPLLGERTLVTAVASGR